MKETHAMNRIRNMEHHVRQKGLFVFGFYLHEFVEMHLGFFYEVNLHEIYPAIVKDELIVMELNDFLIEKMYLLTYNKFEREKLKQAFLATHN